ncbi:MAG: hypothetical protein HQM16_19730, partial [Deltaproteobacteria bacterium]|nr:hypothetical protein [Deltaproteobacteria bacterium]
NDVLVSEDIPVNLLIPVKTRQKTLLVNAISNYVANQEVLERLVLFAHVFNWDKQRFLKFMRPSDKYNHTYSDNRFVFSDEILSEGFGFRLLNHTKKMTADEGRAYIQGIEGLYDHFDMQTALKKYPIRVVQAFGEINAQLQGELVKKVGDMNIYYIR